MEGGPEARPPVNELTFTLAVLLSTVPQSPLTRTQNVYVPWALKGPTG